MERQPSVPSRSSTSRRRVVDDPAATRSRYPRSANLLDPTGISSNNCYDERQPCKVKLPLSEELESWRARLGWSK
jgi:hypothetical protein